MDWKKCVWVLCHYANIWVKTSTLIPKSCDFYFSSSPYWKELGSLWNCLDNLCSPLPCRQNNEYIFNGNLSEYIKRHRRVIKSGAWPLTTRNSYPVPPSLPWTHLQELSNTKAIYHQATKSFMTVKYQHFDLLSLENPSVSLSQLFLKSCLASHKHTSFSLEK